MTPMMQATITATITIVRVLVLLPMGILDQSK
jgi:hypothetical protein